MRVCRKFEWIPLPCDREQACMYVAFLGDKMKYSSVVTYYQAVVYMHVCMGLEPIRMSDTVLKATLRGIQRVEGRGQVGKDPLFPTDLLKVNAALGDNSKVEWIIFVAMVFLFRTLLRV